MAFQGFLLRIAFISFHPRLHGPLERVIYCLLLTWKKWDAGACELIYWHWIWRKKYFVSDLVSSTHVVGHASFQAKSKNFCLSIPYQATLPHQFLLIKLLLGLLNRTTLWSTWTEWDLWWLNWEWPHISILSEVSSISSTGNLVATFSRVPWRQILSSKNV